MDFVLEINTDSTKNKDYALYNRLSRTISKDFKAFSRELDALYNAVETEYENISIAVFSDFFKTLVGRTPILTGNARMNWFISVNGNTGEVIPYPKDATPIQDRTFYKRSLATRTKGLRSRAYSSTGQRISGKFASVKSKAISQIVKSRIAKFVEEYKKSPLKNVTVFNNAKHIIFLEKGHSRQAPNGMVSITLQDFARLVRKHTSGSKVFHHR